MTSEVWSPLGITCGNSKPQVLKPRGLALKGFWWDGIGRRIHRGLAKEKDWFGLGGHFVPSKLRTLR